jgi:hypothetical protein
MARKRRRDRSLVAGMQRDPIACDASVGTCLAEARRRAEREPDIAPGRDNAWGVSSAGERLLDKRIAENAVLTRENGLIF